MMRTDGSTCWPDGIIRPDISDVDGFWTLQIPQRAAAFAALREYEPVSFHPQPHFPGLVAGSGYWALTRLDDVVQASRRPRVFISGAGATSLIDRPVEFGEFFDSMINMDDPRHARMRRIVSRGFTPKRLAGLTESIERTAAAIVDEVIDGGRECEAVDAISSRLPMKIICDMMGVPASQYRLVFENTNIILGTTDPEYVPDTDNVLAAMMQAAATLAELMRDLGEHRVARPTDDVTSVLVNAEIEGERLTSEELASFFILLLAAGNETTRNAISWGIQLLTEHPEQRAVWLADIDGVTPTAVEEIVRLASPVIYTRRTLAEDAVLGGRQLSAGDKVAMFYWAANRDPAHFADPDAFDVRRSPNPHVGFGGPGPHFCLGAHLARREIRVMFRELLTRVPDIHATAAPRRLRSMLLNGIKQLPVAFTAAARP